MAGTAVVVCMNEKKNRDCATSFLEIYVQLYDFEKFCRRMKQNMLEVRYLNRKVNNYGMIKCDNK